MDIDDHGETGVEQLRQKVEDLGKSHPRGGELYRQIDENQAAHKGLAPVDLDAIDPQILKEYAERRLRERTQNTTYIGHRATLDGDGNNKPLGFFFKCPGRFHSRDGAPSSYNCSIRGKRFKDVIPEAAETIGEIRFDTIFSLARLISIYESERSDDRRRFLMTDSKFPFITVTGSQKAFTFFKHCCDHVFRSLALHDGSLLSLPHDGGTGFPIDQLNDLNNEGVKFAKINSWTEVVAKAQRQHSTLLLLPDGFRQVNTAFKPQHNVERKVYFEFHEFSRALETMSENTCIVVGPTLDVTPPKKEWCRFASGLAAAARNGTRVIVLAPPRGDAAYAQIRIELNQAVDLAKKSAALMSRNITSMIPLLESGSEPSHGPAAHPRRRSFEAYSTETMSEFF